MVLWKRKEVIYGKPRDKYSLRKSEPLHLPGVGEYGIPQIEPETLEGNCEFVGFNYAEENAIIQKRKLFISS